MPCFLSYKFFTFPSVDEKDLKELDSCLAVKRGYLVLFLSRQHIQARETGESAEKFYNHILDKVEKECEGSKVKLLRKGMIIPSLI